MEWMGSDSRLHSPFYVLETVRAYLVAHHHGL